MIMSRLQCVTSYNHTAVVLTITGAFIFSFYYRRASLRCLQMLAKETSRAVLSRLVLACWGQMCRGRQVRPHGGDTVCGPGRSWGGGGVQSSQQQPFGLFYQSKPLNMFCNGFPSFFHIYFPPYDLSSQHSRQTRCSRRRYPCQQYQGQPQKEQPTG